MAPTNATKGPWRVFKGHKGSLGILGGGLEVARVLGKHTECGPKDPKVQAANALIVAAAPEMLALIEQLLRVQAVDGPYVEQCIRLLNKAHGDI